jgi:hypothetical protein
MVEITQCIKCKSLSLENHADILYHIGNIMCRILMTKVRYPDREAKEKKLVMTRVSYRR